MILYILCILFVQSEEHQNSITEDRYLQRMIDYMVVERLTSDIVVHDVYLRLVDYVYDVSSAQLVVSDTIKQFEVSSVQAWL